MGNVRLTLFVILIIVVSVESRAAQKVTIDTVLQSPIPDSTEKKSAMRVGDIRKPLIPNRFEVRQNYPNPFNLSTIIEFELPVDAVVYAVIYNILGQKIRTLVNEVRVPGRYSLEWDGRTDAGESVSSGVYFYQLLANGHYAMRKMLLLK